MMFAMLGLKERLGSSVMPRTLGVLLRGSGWFWKVMRGWVLCSLLWVVNSVMEDFEAEADMLFVVSHCSSWVM